MDALQRFWRKEGHALFPAANVEHVEQEDDEDGLMGDEADITPEAQEVSVREQDEKSAAHPDPQKQQQELLQLVHDRALVSEEVRRILNNAQGQDGQASNEATASAADADGHDARTAPPSHNADDLVPCEPGELGEQPKTLAAIVQQVLLKKDSCFALGEASGSGEYNMLKRMKLAVGPVRQFLRLTRLEEGVLSQSILEQGAADLSGWNQREHDLAAARRAADLSSIRTSRTSAWVAATQKLVDNLRKDLPGSSDDGLRVVEHLRPYGETPQVLAIKVQGSSGQCKVVLGITMSVHRGSVTKRGDKIHLKTSYPSPTPLPVQACKKVHVSVLSPCASQKPENVWLTSCASEIMLLEPAGTVLGELTSEVKETSTRLHVQLSPLSAQSLERLSARQLPSAPPAAAPNAEGSDLASRVSSAENNAHASMAFTFNDRCFTKMKLASEVKRFFEGLRVEYERAGLAIHQDGYVQLQGVSHKYDDLVDRVPSFFLGLPELSNVRGFRFSSAVYRKLTTLMPTDGHFSAT